MDPSGVCLVVKHLMIEMHVEECLQSTGNSTYSYHWHV